MVADEHITAARPSADDLVELLRAQVNQSVTVTYQCWDGADYSVSTGTFRVLEVDTFWPSVVMEQRPGAAARVPLSYILSVSSVDGGDLFRAQHA